MADRDESWERFVQKAAGVIRRRNFDPDTATMMASVMWGDEHQTVELVDFNAEWRHLVLLLCYLMERVERTAPADFKSRVQRVARLMEKQLGIKVTSGSVQ